MTLADDRDAWPTRPGYKLNTGRIMYNCYLQAEKGGPGLHGPCPVAESATEYSEIHNLK